MFDIDDRSAAIVSQFAASDVSTVRVGGWIIRTPIGYLGFRVGGVAELKSAFRARQSEMVTRPLMRTVLTFGLNLVLISYHEYEKS